ncbi:carboxylating nicotinate-nucleotide diphosphorylase [Halalkalibacter sp. APA_J-10(15)]|uniref:carboxylating nicotinate-nucleotide diphosphorylase n=1 Tax=Halalkalibacter sp. APA_J-10(15) TaxID=2933805 RepID=UPI001FF124D0|nr:carboxylating nicotinate-nucleotide diphosphorylase [Halalkalibacter sp. APA_J-10(15)]MCK0471135.1 carboxylating nicotinate-nucleotide diphosphorylase [Halalkalibacter sp. APA_J-10(15)]
MNQLLLKRKLEEFFLEDVGEGDVTTESLLVSGEYRRANIVAKEEGVLAGTDVINAGYEVINNDMIVKLFKKDGEAFEKGEVLATVAGKVNDLLAGERVILNLLQRMSGIATMARRAKSVLNDESIRICDTRKTTPGLRMFEKYAVRCGGAYNHRRSLSDAVLLKENHLLASGGVKKAVEAVRERIGHMVKVEVETTNEKEVLEAVTANVDVIMFDNATPKEVKAYQQLVPGHIVTEASGGINLNTLAEYAGCGCHYISLGCLTHSVQSTDISFLLIEEEQR